MASQSLLHIEKVDSSIRDKFQTEVIAIARRLGIFKVGGADWLMIIMNTETGGKFDPKTTNRDQTTAGLIQFIGSTCATLLLGTPYEEAKSDLTKQRYGLRLMRQKTALEQLSYVEVYFKQLLGKQKPIQFTDLHLLAFCPFNIKKDGNPELILKCPENYVFSDIIQKKNVGMDTDLIDGKKLITINSFRRWSQRHYKSNPNTPLMQGGSRTTNSKPDVVKKEEVVKETSPEPPFVLEGEMLYLHTNPVFTTLSQIIEYKNWYDPDKLQPPTPDEILNYKSVGSSSTNRDAVRDSYNTMESKSVPTGSEANLIPVGTYLKIPSKYLIPEFVPFDGAKNIFPNRNTRTFISESLKRVTTSKYYRKKFLHKTSVVEKRLAKPRVLIWCKALGVTKDTSGRPKYKANGELIDISPFVKNVSVNHTKNGATFSFSLAPITISYDEDFNLKILPDSLRWNQSGEGFTHKGLINKKERNKNSYVTQNNFLFHHMISENDVVFISFDKANSYDFKTNTNVIGEPYSFKYDNDKLPNNIFNLIGLVDNNNINIQSSTSNVGITVSGRDLAKLIIEDSSYILNINNEEKQTTGIFQNDNPENWGRPALASKLNMNSDILSASFSKERTVGEMVSFIFNSLVTTEICPDELFVPYRNVDGMPKELLPSKYSFLDLLGGSKTVKEYYAAGIWQIIKILIDPDNVQDRFIRDTTIAVHSGSIMNGLKTLIDDRFVELVSDTYLNSYFFTIRRPPYNFNSVERYLSELVTKNDLDNNSSALDIEQNQVINSNLSWYKGEIYSWYRTHTDFVSYGASRPDYSDELPAVFFREYAEVFGNKGLDVTNIYEPFPGINPKRKDQKNFWDQRSVYEQQRFEDLSYLIETNAYLPFTRQGTITIIGDERIKKGVWIRFRPTNEVYYVDSVTHNYSSSDRNSDFTTIINVSRGMVEINASGQYILPYYFQIISGLEGVDIKEQNKVKSKALEVLTENSKVLFDTDQDVPLVSSRSVSELKEYDELDNLKRVDIENNNKSIIYKYAKRLHDDKSLKIEFYGGTDERGSKKYNQDLGGRRAHSVVRAVKEAYKVLYPSEQPLSDTQIKAVLTFGENVSRDLTKITTEKRTDTAEKDRFVWAKLLRTTSDQTIEDVKPSFDGNYTNLKVNQELFTFFLTRRQFCDRITVYDDLGNYVISNTPNQGTQVSEKQVQKQENPSFWEDFNTRIPYPGE